MQVGPGGLGSQPPDGEEEVGGTAVCSVSVAKSRVTPLDDSISLPGAAPEEEALPVSSAFRSFLDQQGHWVSLPLKGGDSYLEELCPVNVLSLKSLEAEP